MKKNKTKEISMDEEMMIWCAYRYAIGRHTYVNSLAQYIAKEYYNKLSDERLVFTAMDIRRSIADCISWNHTAFKYSGMVSERNRLPIEDFLQYLYDNNITQEQLNEIAEIECSQEHYGDNQPKIYSLKKYDNPLKDYYHSSTDINDLIGWGDLASLFDKKHYYKVHINNNDVDEEIICIKSWIQASEPVNDMPGCYRSIDFKWVPVYKPIDNLIAGKMYSSYIPDEYIKEVTEFDATI